MLSLYNVVMPILVYVHYNTPYEFSCFFTDDPWAFGPWLAAWTCHYVIILCYIVIMLLTSYTHRVFRSHVPPRRAIGLSVTKIIVINTFSCNDEQITVVAYNVLLCGAISDQRRLVFWILLLAVVFLTAVSKFWRRKNPSKTMKNPRQCVQSCVRLVRNRF